VKLRAAAHAAPAWLLGALGFAQLCAAAPLPPSCQGVTPPAGLDAPLKELRHRVETLNESDPPAAFAILCATVPRVERAYGARSPELAWWVASFATPLIAYMDKYDEALPLLQFAQPILERRYGRYGEPLGDIHVAYAWTYFRQGRLAESRAAWLEALKVRERAPGEKQIELQKVLVGLAQVEMSQRDFAAAEAHLQRARSILVGNHDTVSEAGAAIENVLINVAVRQERYADAREHAQEQLRIEEQLQGGAAQLVPAYALLGRILERLDDYEAAEQSLRRAVQLAEGAQGPLQRHHFTALFQLAALLDERGHPQQARETGLKALQIGESTLGSDAPRLVPLLQVLGDAELRLGHLPESLAYYQRAAALIDKERANLERPWLVDYYRGFGALQMNLGDPAAAQAAITAGLEAAGEDRTFSVAGVALLLDRARAARALGTSPDRSELLTAVSLLRSRLPDSHPAILRVFNEMCAAGLEGQQAQAGGDCSEALRRADEARDVDPALRAVAYENQSRYAAEQQDAGAARNLAVRAVAAAESTAAPDPLWRAYFRLAQVLHAGGEQQLAVFFGKAALTEVERERGELTGAAGRYQQGFLRDKVDIYRHVADWLMELGRIDEGLAVLALMKSTELSDFGVRAASSGEHSVELTPGEVRLRERYAQAVQADAASGAELSRLAALREAQHISPAEQTQLAALIEGKSASERERASHIEALLNDNGTSGAPAEIRARQIETAALTQTARSFGADSLFAVYLLTEQHLRVLINAAGVQTELRIPVDSAALQREIGGYLDDIARRHEAAGEETRLYDLLVRPVDGLATQHHLHRLVLWLDGPLRYVPLGSLRAGNTYLIDKYTVQLYAPPAPTAAAHATTSRAHTPAVRGLGVTRAVGGFAALPGVGQELCAVVHGPITGLDLATGACAGAGRGTGALTGEGFADAAFTEERVRELLSAPRDFSVLHIGTHFRLRPGNALRSFLLLGDGSRLTLDTMGGWDFSGIDVVTLSGCETGMGGARTDDGREVEALSALVQRRGAGRVIASLWQVDDASTAQLMHTLYTGFVADHGDAALALQQAQRALRLLGEHNGVNYANPYYWAGFFVAGSRP